MVKMKDQVPYGGTIEYTDNFSATDLDLNWEFLRAPKEQWYSLTRKTGFLSIQLRPETCGGKDNPSFLGRRQQHATSSAATEMEFRPKGENEKAGLLVFQNETHYYFLCKSLDGGRPAVQLFRSSESGGGMELLNYRTLSEVEGRSAIVLRIESRGNTYAFFYSFGGRELMTLKDGVDGTFLSTKVAGGFVGCMYAVYGTSLNIPTDNNADFNWFAYSGDGGGQ